MAKPRVTYLLGAGASYNALPVVSELSAQLKYLHSLLGNSTLDGLTQDKVPHEELKKKVQGSIEDLLRGIEQSTTVDNYARILAANGRHKKLHELKACLSYFFTVKQLASVGLFTRGVNAFFSDIDNRYIPLLLKYLPTTGADAVLPDNINFISWNYDFQLELALKQIRDFEYLSDVFGRYQIYPDPTHQNPNAKQIIHLNGIAGAYSISGSSRYNTIFDRHSGKREIKELLSGALFIFESVDRERISFNELFSFAWERDVKESAEAIARAKQVMQSTEILVVIGYSFPNYNRDVDREILNSANGLEKLYYQDPNAHLVDFRRMFGLVETEVIQWPQESPFVVPLEY